jgi:hypothetical protein
MGIDFNAFEQARQQADSQNQGFGGGNTDWFNLKDGETKYLRFLNGLVDYVTVSHSCGATLVDIKKSDVEAARAAGQPIICPGCGQPLSDSDIQYERPSIIVADVHRYVLCGADHHNFVCLSSVLNAKQGLVETNPDGTPKWKCPIDNMRANLNKNGKPKRPAMRGYAVAVEREAAYQQVNVNGRITNQLIGMNDTMTVDDNGSEHPKVVLVEMSFVGFWQQIYNALGSNDYSRSICDYDWMVTRVGSGMDTKYLVQMVSPDPSPVDMRVYEQWMPDVMGFVKGIGTPAYYVKQGIGVEGYVNEAAQQQAPQSAPQGFVPQQQPTQQQYPQQAAAPQPQFGQQPVGAPAISWDKFNGRSVSQ